MEAELKAFRTYWHLPVIQCHLGCLWTPTDFQLSPEKPLWALLVQVFSLWDQALMKRTAQQRDALFSGCISEVLAGHADLA